MGTISKEPSKVIYFSTVFNGIGKNIHKPVFVEGSPLFDVLADEKNISRVQSVLDARATDEASIQAIANAFDYQAEINNSALLLRKRFTVAHNIPDLSFVECQRILRKIEAAVSSVYPAPMDDTRAPVLALLGQFSTEQTAKLGEGFSGDRLDAEKGGVPVTALSSSQKDLLFHIVVNSTQYTFPRIREGLDFLRKVQRGDTTLGWFDLQAGGHNYNLYGLEFPRGNNISPTRYPLDTQFVPDLNGCITIPAGALHDQKEFVQHRDVAAKGRLAGEEKQPATAGAATVGELVSQFNKTVSQPFIVDSAYQSKKVCAFNTDGIKSDVQFGCIADLFGLPLRTMPNGSLRLTDKRTSTRATLENLPMAVSNALPGALVRYLNGRKSALLAEPSNRLSEIPQNPQRAAAKRRMTDRMASRGMINKIAVEMRNGVLRSLLMSLAPEHQSRETKKRFYQLDTTQQNMLGQLCLSHCLAAVETLTQPVPPFITHFDSGVIHARPLRYDNKPFYCLDLSVVDPASGKRTGCSISVPQGN